MSRSAFFLLGTALALSGCGSSDGDSGPRTETPDSGSPDADFGEPLSVDADEAWHWIEFPDSHCVNGSPAGIAANFTTKSRNLAFVFEGGGNCWNELTCVQIRTAINMDGLPEDPLSMIGDPANPMPGMWDRADESNPFRDWNFVVAAYCTADGHIGNKTTTYGSTTLQHVGFANTAAYLKRVVPTFADADQVLVAGSSAGGMGALGNYDPIARAFQAAGGPVPLLVDDAGPVLRAPYLTLEAAQAMQTAWGLEQTIGARCKTCTAEGGFYTGWEYLARTWPGMRGTLLSSLEDNAVRLLYGALNTGTTTSMDAAQFTAGLEDFADWQASQQEAVAPSATHVFYYPGGRHMALAGVDIAATPGLSTFLADMLARSDGWNDVRR
jgi:hypothetical protein